MTNLDAPLGTALAEIGVPIDPVAIERFNRLSGMTFGSCSLVPDLRRARELYGSRPYLDPIFFLPIGSAAYPQINSTVATLALHLRPCDVAARRLPVVAISTGTIGQRTPIAHDVDYLVWRALAREAENEGRFSLDEVARANDIFGPRFFDPGHLERPTRDEVLTILSPCQVDGEIFEELTRSYGSAMSWAHEYFHAYAREALRHYQIGDRARAARYAARSLGCHHYTGEMLDEGEYHDMLRELLEEVPSAFSEDARIDVSLFGWEPDLVAEAERMEHQGRLDRAMKLLVDAAHFSFEGNSYLGRLHHLFLRLDWKWAARLAALR